jgi:hypothetical protein
MSSDSGADNSLFIEELRQHLPAAMADIMPEFLAQAIAEALPAALEKLIAEKPEIIIPHILKALSTTVRRS